MSTMPDSEKLRMLLPHWIEHNRSHAEEFSKWAARVREAGSLEIADTVARAAALLDEAEAALREALGRAGGPLPSDGHGHHHEHS